MNRDEVPSAVSRRLSGRPVRWATREQLVGDYDGRERTLEVFLADAKDQMALRAAIEVIRSDVAEAAGGPIVLIFHTTKESQRLHAAFLREFASPRPVAKVTRAILQLGEGAYEDRSVKRDEMLPHRLAARAA